LTGDAGRGCGDASRALLFVYSHNVLRGRSPVLCGPHPANTPQQQKNSARGEAGRFFVAAIRSG
jgi:hypothetical protein